MNIPFSKSYTIVAILGAVFTWGAMNIVGVYRARRGAGLWHQLSLIYFGWIIVVVFLLVIGWVTKNSDGYSRIVLTSWLIVCPMALSLMHVLQRMLLRLLRKNGKNTRRVVIVGAGDLGIQLAHRILDSDWMGITIVGFFDDDNKKHNTTLLNIPILGSTKDVFSFVQNEGIEHVYLALPMRSEKRMREVFDELQDTTASLFLIPDLFVFELLGARELDIAGLPAFALCETPLTGPYGMLKRIEA